MADEQPKKAIMFLNFCINLVKEEGNIQREVVTLIRFGEALKYDNQQITALRTFEKALDLCIENNLINYEDFALQHKGKYMIELGLLEDAEKCLLRALYLRKLKNDNALIESTQKAIELIEQLKKINKNKTVCLLQKKVSKNLTL